MIQPHALVVFPTVPEISPERPEQSVRLHCAQRIHPSLRQQTFEGVPDIGLQKCIGLFMVPCINIGIRRNDIVIAGEDDRHARSHLDCRAA